MATQVRVPEFQFGEVGERDNGEGAAKFGFFNGADKGFPQRIGYRGGEAVGTLAVVGFFSQAEAGEQKYVVAGDAYPVRGLPGFVALYARTGVEDVVPGEADMVIGVGLGWGVELAIGAEERAEAGAMRAEVALRCHGKINFEAGGEEEDAVDA